jgi:hypothetical protein
MQTVLGESNLKGLVYILGRNKWTWVPEFCCKERKESIEIWPELEKVPGAKQKKNAFGFSFFKNCCAGWGYIVTFTKVLTIYQIYHT